MRSSDKPIAKPPLAHAARVGYRPHASTHALPFDDAQFDLVVLMHALTYADEPARAVAEAARVLRPGGRLLLSSLARHEHRGVVEAYGHVNLGFTDKELQRFVTRAGLEVLSSGVVTRERRPPHFEVISVIAWRPESTPPRAKGTR